MTDIIYLSRFGAIDEMKISVVEHFLSAPDPHKRSGRGKMEIMQRSTRAELKMRVSKRNLRFLLDAISRGVYVVALRKRWAVAGSTVGEFNTISMQLCLQT